MYFVEWCEWFGHFHTFSMWQICCYFFLFLFTLFVLFSLLYAWKLHFEFHRISLDSMTSMETLLWNIVYLPNSILDIISIELQINRKQGFNWDPKSVIDWSFGADIQFNARFHFSYGSWSFLLCGLCIFVPFPVVIIVIVYGSYSIHSGMGFIFTAVSYRIERASFEF